MASYQWAKDNGQIISKEYVSNNILKADQLIAELNNAMAQFGADVLITQVNSENLEVYSVKYTVNDEDQKIFYTSLKGLTPGGRNNILDEQRIQQKAKNFKCIYNLKEEGNTAIILGVYKYENTPIFCAWKVVSSEASDETPISKQIKISVIANAIKYGFEQQINKTGGYVCAFRKEFIFFYLKNCLWLHDIQLSLIANNIDSNRYTDNITNSLIEKCYNKNYLCEYERNRIIFGAPGTGKSFMLEKERKKLLKDGGTYERVTFHPDYSYANFVGTYKPVPIEIDGKETITYSYVPGPFMRLLAKALNNIKESNILLPHLLIIDEINRANVAAVFGDIFQLLDRDANGTSEYSVSIGRDIREYLAQELDESPDVFEQIIIPNNLFIWATMNSADQGVFPMDTAFKRRWEFTHIGINENESELKGKYVLLSDSKTQKVEWNSLRRAINNFLANEKINEDKQLGPYFISHNIVIPKNGDEIDRDKFINTFKNKVIMYLFEDAAKQKRHKLFEGCSHNYSRYSEICDEFDKLGVSIFNKEIVNECGVKDIDYEGNL